MMQMNPIVTTDEDSKGDRETAYSRGNSVKIDRMCLESMVYKGNDKRWS